MILRAFSVFDVKSDLFGTPFFMSHIGQAVRAFTDLVNDPQSQISRFPSDFCLKCIGSFNDATGEFVNERPTLLGFGSDFLKSDLSVSPPRQELEVVNGRA